MRCRHRTVLLAIGKQVRKLAVPYVTAISRKRHRPYEVLISCLISLRTKEEVTQGASRRLFQAARTPQEMIKLTQREIEKAIYPAGFYRTKAKTIREISAILLKDFSGEVPRTERELLSLKGVGLKTAHLVMGLGHRIPAICVDTHVHRISNRLGWVRTKTPEETGRRLERIIPQNLWIMLNTVIVTFGQNICMPVSPWCSRCDVAVCCRKAGVMRFR